MKSGKRKLSILEGNSKERARSSSMPVDYTACDPGQLQNPALYINRELSWFEFNQRVLDQAMDPSHPLLERVKFLAIVGNNLDEFFMIRLATILKKFRAGIEDISPDGMSTQEQIRAIRERALRMMEDQNECWEQTLRPRLEENGVHFLEARQYTPAVQEYLRDYFSKQIFPVLTPLALDPAHPFPHISNLSTNFAVGVESGGERKFARVKIPNMLPRFVPIPEKISPKPGLSFAFLEDVMRGNLAELFPGIPVEEAYLFRVIRDTDLVIQEDEADDLLESVDKSLKQLRYGAVSLLTVETAMPPRLLDILLDNFQIEEDMAIQKNSRMCFSDWLELTALHLPQLKYPPFSPRPLFNREEEEKIFDRFRYTDYLVHHPYESFTTVESFLKVAVDDPQVVAIKMTLYRIGPNSPIVDQLIEAAEAGKQVAAVIELKARFDERNNIVWANRLESAGVHVNYGLVNLKTHAKLCMVVRKEGEGVRRYVHLGTGNYNRSTAQIYTDLGLFTTNPEIAEDVSEVFNYLTGYSNKRSFHRLLVAPINLRSAFLQLIERETEHARAGRPARLILKCNHLTDLRIIQALYRASQAGVDVDMIVRSVCGLRPGIPGISEGIRVSSIVGRFLEHHRIYYFQNGGEEEIFIGSADLMERNLDHRVETLCPILDPAWREQLKTKVLEVMLQDNVRASQLYFDGHYEKIPVSPETERLDSQQTLLECYTAKTRVPDNA